MYWNPMSSWPDWLTTSLAIASWGVAACLAAVSVRQAFRTSTPDDQDAMLETPQDHRLTRTATDRVVTSAVGRDE